MRADEPLRVFAEATGGASGTAAKIPSAISSLQDRVIITYQVSRPPDGRPRRVEVRARRTDLTVRTFGWSTDATSEETAVSRTAALLRSDPTATGELPTSVTVDWTKNTGRRRRGEIVIRAPLGALNSVLGNRRGVFRITIAGAEQKGRLFTIHRVVSDYDMTLPVFVYRAPIQATKGRLDLAATVEELTTGMWGGQKAK